MSSMTTKVIMERITTVNNIELQQNCTSSYSRCNTNKNISASTISNINTETTRLYANTFTDETLIKGGLNEKIKDTVFIITTSSVVTIIVLVMIFAKVMLNRNMKNPPFPKYPVNSGSKYHIPKFRSQCYPLSNISSYYEKNWNDYV